MSDDDRAIEPDDLRDWRKRAATLTECPACGGVVHDASCTLCGDTGCVSASTAEAWRARSR